MVAAATTFAIRRAVRRRLRCRPATGSRDHENPGVAVLSRTFRWALHRGYLPAVRTLDRCLAAAMVGHRHGRPSYQAAQGGRADRNHDRGGTLHRAWLRIRKRGLPDPMDRPRRRWRRSATASFSLLAAAGMLAACAGEDSSAATWVVDPHEQVTNVTTGFTAVVTRVGCSNGLQGEPRAPEIEYAESEVRITFRISPHTADGTCQGTAGVPYKVELSEPVRNRALVDGECHPGSTAWATAFCQHHGVRYSPH
jgi:hypothetical protein